MHAQWQILNADRGKLSGFAASGRATLLAAQYAEARRRENQREGLVSACSLAIDPGATCQAGRCTLPPASGLSLQK